MLTKLIPSITAVIVLVVSQFADVINAYVSAHPSIAIVLAAVGTIVGNLTKSPNQT